MNKCLLVAAILFSINSIAYTGPKLIMTREKPSLKCEIYNDRVVVTRKIGEIKFTKTEMVKSDGLDAVIEKAYLKGPMTEQKTEYAAVYITRNASTNEIEAKNFNMLYSDSVFASNLIYVTTSLCDLKNL